MATTTRLKMTYNTSNGTVTHSWNYADSEVTPQAITALANATITNGVIFRQVPLTLKEAKLVVTTETDKTPS